MPPSASAGACCSPSSASAPSPCWPPRPRCRAFIELGRVVERTTEERAPAALASLELVAPGGAGRRRRTGAAGRRDESARGTRGRCWAFALQLGPLRDVPGPAAEHGSPNATALGRHRACGRPAYADNLDALDQVVAERLGDRPASKEAATEPSVDRGRRRPAPGHAGHCRTSIHSSLPGDAPGSCRHGSGARPRASGRGYRPAAEGAARGRGDERLPAEGRGRALAREICRCSPSHSSARSTRSRLWRPISIRFCRRGS